MHYIVYQMSYWKALKLVRVVNQTGQRDLNNVVF